MWKKHGRFELGLNKVDIRSIKIKDETGRVRKLRVCSVWENFSKFTGIPVSGCLCKDERGYIGVILAGKNSGYIKVGKNFLISQNLIVPFNSIGKNNLKKLLKGYNIDLIEIEETIYGIEKMREKINSKEIIEKMKEFALKKNICIYLVGGYIRDKFLKKKSKDIDFVMEEDALKIAREFSEMFNLPQPVFYGRFGTAMIEIKDIKLEFATARKESYPENSRKPFIKKTTIYEDLERRDFTINAIAQNLITGEILDPFDGRGDIKRKIIKTPVDPEKTFYDDPLRILRGIRFATKFKFNIEKKTMESMKNNRERIKIVSEERIADEIMKILECSTPSIGFELMDKIGLLEIILPEIANLKEKRTEHPCKELFTHTLKTLNNTSKFTKNIYIRLSALLHDIGKPYTLKIENGKVSFHRHEFVGEKMSYKICRRLKISEENTKFVGRLVRFHLRPHLLAKENPTDSALRRFIKEVGKDMKALFILAKSDLTSRNPLKVKEALERLEKLEERVKEINKRDKLSSFKLAINGFDIMEILKIPSGKKVGIIKEYIENLVIDKQLPNKKRILRKYITDNADKLLSL